MKPRAGSRGGIELRARGKAAYLPLAPTRANLARAARLARAVSPAAVTVTEAADAFWRSARGRLAASTLSIYQRTFRRVWLPAIGLLPLAAVLPADIRAVLDTVPGTEANRRAVLAPLRQIYRYARDEREWLAFDPSREIHIGPAQRPLVDPFSREETERILARLDGEAKLFFTLAFFTGLRCPSEILALTWRDYDGRGLRVSRARVAGVMQAQTKTHRARYVELGPAARAALDAAPRRGLAIFSKRNGMARKKACVFLRQWRPALAAAAVRYRRPYNCRHSYASQALMAGLRPAFIAGQLGHSLPVFYSVYARYIDGERAQDVAKLSLF